MITQLNHYNPCRQKVPTPILKHSNMFNSSQLPQLCTNNNLVTLGRKQSCPQITKIRNNKSIHNILSSRGAHEGNQKQVVKNNDENNNQNQQGIIHHENTQWNKKQDKNYQQNTSRKRKPTKQSEINDENVCTFDKNKQKKVKRTVGQYVKKKSVQTIVGICIDKKINVHQISQCQKYQPKNSNQLILITPESLDNALLQNSTLTSELSKKQSELTQIQNQYFNLQQKYIRLLQVSNERSQSQIKILLDSNQSRLNKSKLKNSTLSQKAVKLKAKLQNLDLSGIKNSKQNSFKLSEAI